MNERIRKLTELTMSGKMHVKPVKTNFDRTDLFLPPEEMNIKRLCEYIENQEPLITEYSCMTGIFNFDGSVVGDAFSRSGHKNTALAYESFYLKPIENLSTMEAQHATADYTRVLQIGISGIIDQIDASLATHDRDEEIRFLKGLKSVAYSMIAWADKCSRRAWETAQKTESLPYRENLLKLSQALKKVPKNAPESFYEAVLCIYVCFSAADDSVGTLDRYLSPFYQKDVENNVVTREEAKEYVQELLLMLQAKTPIDNPYFTRGGQSHFCVGGYLPDGTDGFSETSRLIVESLMELPSYIPEITFRWTEKTPHDVFRFMLDCERRDPNKRIAFTNDDKRLKCYTEICGIPFQKAVNYTMVGCNEPAFVGSIIGSNSKGNVLRCIDALFHEQADKIQELSTFDEFYAVFEKEFFSDLDKIYEYDEQYNRLRARDINYITCLFFNGCIENAKSLTQGGADIAVSSPMLLGLTNLIDSILVVKQFVYDEKEFSMQELLQALQADWNGCEDMRRHILKKGRFFGNDDELSNGVAQKIYRSFYRYMKDKTNLFGYHYVVADSVGYNEHHKWFGEKTRATPDGRHAGDPLKYGIGQSEGKDREGLTAYLNSVAKLDPNAIACGSTVTNILLEEQLIRNDVYFEKIVYLLETYFRQGGVQFQLNYISPEQLKAAQNCPEEYQNLRVRVTGFSDYFVRLKKSMQDEIIERTVKNG